MKYMELVTIKNEMKKIVELMDFEDLYYNDFKWFSEINYTTTTEYLGELRIFIKKLQYNNKFKKYQKKFKIICKSIDKLLNLQM